MTCTWTLLPALCSTLCFKLVVLSKSISHRTSRQRRLTCTRAISKLEAILFGKACIQYRLNTPVIWCREMLPRFRVITSQRRKNSRLRSLSLLFLLFFPSFSEFSAPPFCLGVSFLSETRCTTHDPNISPWFPSIATSVPDLLCTIDPGHKKRVTSLAK